MFVKHDRTSKGKSEWRIKMFVYEVWRMTLMFAHTCTARRAWQSCTCALASARNYTGPRFCLTSLCKLENIACSRVIVAVIYAANVNQVSLNMLTREVLIFNTWILTCDKFGQLLNSSALFTYRIYKHMAAKYYGGVPSPFSPSKTKLCYVWHILAEGSIQLVENLFWNFMLAVNFSV